MKKNSCKFFSKWSHLLSFFFNGVALFQSENVQWVNGGEKLLHVESSQATLFFFLFFSFLLFKKKQKTREYDS